MNGTCPGCGKAAQWLMFEVAEQRGAFCKSLKGADENRPPSIGQPKAALRAAAEDRGCYRQDP